MKKSLSTRNILNIKKTFILFIFLINALYNNTAKAQFPCYTMVNYINNVVQFPTNFAAASPASITDTLLTTCWYNVGYPAGADILYMTWDTPFFNGPGQDVLIAIWDNNASGGANVRFQLTDNSYTSSMFVDFLSGLITSAGGIISPVGYNRITNSITTYPNTPRAKVLDISDFYNGALAVKGIEFSGFTASHIDLLAISATQNATPLPLILSNFVCTDFSGTPFLQWQTKTEINTSHFEIEKSTDGVLFSSIHEVTAAGNSGQTRNYSYRDMNINAGANKIYYRLKMVDIDNHFIYSEVCSYQKGISNQYIQPTLVQNPVKNEISFYGGNAGTAYTLANVAGKAVYKGIINDNQTTILAQQFPNGIYILEFAGNKYEKIKICVAH